MLLNISKLNNLHKLFNLEKNICDICPISYIHCDIYVIGNYKILSSILFYFNSFTIYENVNITTNTSKKMHTYSGTPE